MMIPFACGCGILCGAIIIAIGCLMVWVVMQMVAQVADGMLAQCNAALAQWLAVLGLVEGIGHAIFPPPLVELVRLLAFLVRYLFTGT